MSKPVAPRFVPGPVLPWWRVGMVWLALAGPAVVVVAGVATAVIAINGADPPLRPAASNGANTPAVQARNHAATGGAPGASR